MHPREETVALARRENNLNDLFPTRQCSTCGKEFCEASPDWAYKIRRPDNSTKYFCSWSCLCAYRKKYGETRKRTLRHRSSRVFERNQEIYSKRRAGASIEDLAHEYNLAESYIYKMMLGFKR